MTVRRFGLKSVGPEGSKGEPRGDASDRPWFDTPKAYPGLSPVEGSPRTARVHLRVSHSLRPSAKYLRLSLISVRPEVSKGGRRDGAWPSVVRYADGRSRPEPVEHLGARGEDARFAS